MIVFIDLNMIVENKFFNVKAISEKNYIRFLQRFKCNPLLFARLRWAQRPLWARPLSWGLGRAFVTNRRYPSLIHTPQFLFRLVRPDSVLGSRSTESSLSLYSPLLRESQLVFLPPLRNMLKFSG